MAAHQRKDIMRSWYLASLVKRYHTWPTITIETVGQHSHGVAVIWCRYFGNMDINMSMAILRWILEHDLAEMWTGDAPFPAKIRFPALGVAHREAEVTANAALGVTRPDLDHQTMTRIKVCDMLQMYLYGRHEVNMGNSYAIPMANDMLTEAVKIAAGDELAVDAINQFVEDNRD